MGDPAGIGPDLIASAWLQRHELKLPPFVAYADPETLRQRACALGNPIQVQAIDKPPLTGSLPDDSLAVFDIGRAASHRPGHPDTDNAATVIAAIEAGVDAIVQGHASALVTAPIAKHVLQGADFRHAGHTEFLGELAGRHWPDSKATPVMMLASDDLLVVPLTVHVPLADVPDLITEMRIVETTEIVVDALHKLFGIAEARIAIAGLNPHAGEEGMLGMQERDVIEPAVSSLKSQGFSVSGPHSADTLFHAEARTTYDAVIAMYHDQALIPIKTLAFDSAVNTTLGLPFIRTSPDHGTAFDIAGSGKASIHSFAAAMRLAARLAQTKGPSPTS